MLLEMIWKTMDVAKHKLEHNQSTTQRQKMIRLGLEPRTFCDTKKC
jgi:hypothetical protein